MNSNRILVIIAVTLGVLVLAVGGILITLMYTPRAPTFAHGLTIETPQPMLDFTLTGGDGKQHSLSDFRGRVVMLFFGYTHCPDVCPLTLTHLKNAMTLLGPASDDVQVVMVTVDPERDTPEHMQEYIQYFDPRFLGLSGSRAQIDEIAQLYGISFSHDKPDAQGNYLVAHYAGVLTFDKQGAMRVAFPFGTTGEQFAQDLKRLLE